MIGARDDRKLLVPEVIQTSSMDCGPASLQALLTGHGIPVRYARLREACQTDVDGTSIDMLEEVANELGLDAEQYIVPLDHLLMDEAEALPALIVTQQATGLTHFVVAWRSGLGLVMVMDPATGRVLRRARDFLREVFVHELPASPELAHDWLRAPAFLDPLRRRMRELGVEGEALIARAVFARGWLPVAALDAAVRLSRRLVDADALEPGPMTEALITRLSAAAAAAGERGATQIIPATDWVAVAQGEDTVALRGAVLVHVEGRRDPDTEGDRPRGPSSPELREALGHDTQAPVGTLLVRARRAFPGLAILPLALVLAGAATTLEAAVLAGLVLLDPSLDVGGLSLSSTAMVAMIAAFFLVVSTLELSISALLARLGRWLDLHLRTRLLLKLPRLGNHYFHSRLSSDLAYRAHELRALRSAPAQIGDVLRVGCEVLTSAVGLALLVPDDAAAVLAASVVMLALPLLALPRLRAQDLRRQTHVGALVRFHLDALLGLLPIRAHDGERSIRGEHESLLARWAEATRELDWTSHALLALELGAGLAFAVWITLGAVAGEGFSGLTVLTIYWALKLPLLAQTLIDALRELPEQHNRLARVHEILTGPEETELLGPAEPAPRVRSGAGVHVEMDGVGVHAGGQELLTDINLTLEPGEHVAIVGASGAGKTTLVGLLLGWHRASAGSLALDGALVGAAAIHQLRRETAWVDPVVALWNRSLVDNLRYGNEHDAGGLDARSLDAAIEQAELREVVEGLDAGLDTVLGEGGSVLSGGEGQRVRFARALLRPKVRLCVLDEPFRGLELDRRARLLARAREHWRQATLVFVSHDIDAALGFARVVVLDGGRLVEDGPPAELLADPGSRLAALANAHRDAKARIWRRPIWRRWWIEDGVLGQRDEGAP